MATNLKDSMEIYVKAEVQKLNYAFRGILGFDYSGAYPNNSNKGNAGDMWTVPG